MYRLYGINPSPYSVKVRAILRYRRLPFVWDTNRDAREIARSASLPPVIPVLQFPDGMVLNDSTPLALELERRHPEERSIVPDDPALAFVSALLEDMADEWLTKAMFHYRWYYAPDRRFAQIWISGDRAPGTPESARAAAMQTFNDRQVGRMAMVGCTEENRPVIEGSYRAVLSALEAVLADRPFLLGSRPSLADFGLFGQLQILATDPTPALLMRELAPNVFTWLLRLDDASGVEGEWYSLERILSGGVRDLLHHAAATYLPFMAANAGAFAEGSAEVAVELQGRPFRQAPFRYQAKCWDTLKHQFRRLAPQDRMRLDPVLRETKCLVLLD